MNYKQLPDKWIRKAIYDGLNGVSIGSDTINVYDYRVPIEKAPKVYILMTSQTSTPDRGNKCDIPYNSVIRVEVVTQFASSGNTGSRLLADEGMQLVIDWFNGNSLIDNLSGFVLSKKDIDFGSDIQNTLPNYSIFRKVALLSFYLQ